jgi:hypothetical protein
MNAHELTAKMADLLGRLRASTQSMEEQELLAAAIDAILFITSTGQRYAFVDYIQQRESDAPPPVVASFDTREEAEAWLKKHPEPPDGTHVLIANQYHHVTYSREVGLRRLSPSSSLEDHFEYLIRKGLPAPVATFNSREEADKWLASQTEPPNQAFILIEDKPHLAIYHRNIAHRAIYP